MCFFACGVSANASDIATTVTFEEVGIPVPAASIVSVDQVGPMTFGSARILDASNLYGHVDLSVSFPNAVYFGPNETVYAALSDGRRFDFLSAYFGATHTDGAGFQLRGFRDGHLVYSASAPSAQLHPSKFMADWTDIDRVSIQSNFFSSGYNMMDNFVYRVTAVPEPSSLIIFGGGLVTLWTWSRRKRRSTNAQNSLAN